VCSFKSRVKLILAMVSQFEARISPDADNRQPRLNNSIPIVFVPRRGFPTRCPRRGSFDHPYRTLVKLHVCSSSSGRGPFMFAGQHSIQPYEKSRWACKPDQSSADHWYGSRMYIPQTPGCLICCARGTYSCSPISSTYANRAAAQE
jgi:hypothetical protein